MTIPRARRRTDQDAVSWSLASDPALDRLLQEASAPAHADELVGLAAALTAFAHTAPLPRRHPMSSFLVKLLAAKALAASAAGATALGGVALVAATGNLPAPLQDAAHQSFGAPSSTSSHSSDSTETEQATTEAATPSPTPSPNLIGLCRAYAAGVKDANGKALENPAFTALKTAAVGATDCTKLLADAPGGKPDQAGQSDAHKPASHPGGKPASVPAGQPKRHDGGQVTTPATGAPATHPGKP
jgi:hypothetical protein